MMSGWIAPQGSGRGSWRKVRIEYGRRRSKMNMTNMTNIMIGDGDPSCQIFCWAACWLVLVVHEHPEHRALRPAISFDTGHTRHTLSITKATCPAWDSHLQAMCCQIHVARHASVTSVSCLSAAAVGAVLRDTHTHTIHTGE